MPCVYLTINKINGKKYIGVDTKDDPNYFGSGVIIKESIKKYGKNNFVKEILEKSEDIKYLFDKEKEWISKYDALNSVDFYNLSEGGKGGNNLNNDESINKWKLGIEKSISITIEKRKNKTYDEIYGDKSSIEKEKRSLSLLGQKHSLERRKNNSDGHKNQVPWNKGLDKSDPRVLKNVENRKQRALKSYILSTPNNTNIIFNGKKELEIYIRKINENLNLKERINVDSLIKNGCDKQYKIDSNK